MILQFTSNYLHLQADGTMSEAAIPAVTKALEVFQCSPQLVYFVRVKMWIQTWLVSKLASCFRKLVPISSRRYALYCDGKGVSCLFHFNPCMVPIQQL